MSPRKLAEVLGPRAESTDLNILRDAEKHSIKVSSHSYFKQNIRKLGIGRNSSFSMIDLFERQSFKELDERVERERKRKKSRDLPCADLLPSGHVSGAQSARSQDPRTLSGSPVWVAKTQTLGSSPMAFPGNNNELEWKWNSWDLNRHAKGCQGHGWPSNYLPVPKGVIFEGLFERQKGRAST